ncbi:MAG TPA: DUF2760 domain-containing protein [Terriglobia bacterium]|nr:DUF2760 domain-containing protein [Terriglobia bacterium]
MCYGLSMGQQIAFFDRLKMAWRILIHADFAATVQDGLHALEARQTKAAAPSPDRVHASALMFLAAMQREGRLIDFLQQEVAAFSDEDVGAAARVVHRGCRQVLQQFFDFEPSVSGEEGTPMSVPAGFDSQRIRLIGNVTGQPPFKGTLKHHGWTATAVRLPVVSEALDPRVVAPAEVELQ